MTSDGSILGSWQLVAAAESGPIRVSATPAMTIKFNDDGIAVIWTGVNAINLTVRYESGAITARFRVTTAAYDGNTDPDHLAILRLFNAAAPMTGPPPAVRSSYRIHGNQLTIQVETGMLEFTRNSTAGQPAGSTSTSSASAAPIVVEPS